MKTIGMLTAALLLAAAPCLAQVPDQDPSGQVSSGDNSHFSWADVLRVDPVYNTTRQAAPRQECWEEQVPLDDTDSDSDAAREDSQRGAASVVGAIIGAFVGNRFGHGGGRAAATAAGAVAGGVIGNNVAAANERAVKDGEPRYTVRRHCRAVDGTPPRRIVGYDVEYRYRGDIYTARLPHDPGDRLRVRVTVTPVE